MGVVKRVATIALVCVLWGGSSAQADYPEAVRKCKAPPLAFNAFPCSRTFIARKHPQQWTFAKGAVIDTYASRWVTEDGHKFLTGDRRGCTMFGRYKGLRVRERFCEGIGPLTIAVRSVSGPTPVRFSFAVIR
jgi:hypothetical protein